jgi:phage terminase large subunit-like protein
MSDLTDEERAELLEQLRLEEALSRRLSSDILSRLTPNARQWDYICAESHETMFSGLNQAGKSTALCMKAAYHLTGLYPDGYEGPRFDGPINAAIGGETAQSTRDLLCERLLGPVTDRGTGYVPIHAVEQDRIVRISGGVANQIDYFEVRHYDEFGEFDGYSKCYVFSYSSGWQRLQGYTLHWIGCDEEPPFEVYDEFSARLNATNGYMDIAMTPLQGETELYLLFENSDNKEIRCMLNYDIADTDHMSDEDRERLISKYENHPLAEARLHGRPVRGAGLIYTMPDEYLYVNDFEIPRHWKKIIGLDFPHGVGTFAAVKMAYDEDTDIVYLTGEYKESDQEFPIYVHRLLNMGGGKIPCAWPHDGGRGFTDGSTIASKYKDYGVNMLRDFSHMVNMEGKKTFAIMTVIEEICERMATDRFKVFVSCQKFMAEKRRYKHDHGKVAKRQDDHLIDAMHKGIMMLRYAEADNKQSTAGFRLPEFDFFSGY